VPAIVVSDPAERDLAAIWAYIATDNPSAATKFLQKLKSRCESYAHQPQLGEARADLASGLRCFSVGQYTVFYRAITDGVEIARVIHSARDINVLI